MVQSFTAEKLGENQPSETKTPGRTDPQRTQSTVRRALRDQSFWG